MGRDDWTVVKIGGSLFDWPELGARLRAWLRRLDTDRVLLVPGGGRVADAVRQLDRTHQLDAEASHWLAIQAMSLNAVFLQALLPTADIVADPDFCASGWWILDALPFFRADEASVGRMPHGWHVTSDSLAIRAAVRVNAREVILLKSADWQGEDWTKAASAGVVDGWFADALQQTPPDMRIWMANLRTC